MVSAVGVFSVSFSLIVCSQQKIFMTCDKVRLRGYFFIRRIICCTQAGAQTSRHVCRRKKARVDNGYNIECVYLHIVSKRVQGNMTRYVSLYVRVR